MSDLVPALSAAFALAGAGSLLLHHVAVETVKQERVVRRLREAAGDRRQRVEGVRRRTARLLRAVEGRFLRAGIEPDPRRGAWLAGLILCALAAAWACLGAIAAALVLVALVATGTSTLSWLGNRREVRILDQLPGFLEHVIRAASTGSNLYAAFEIAMEESGSPLREVMCRIPRQVQVGATLDEALLQTTAPLGLKEFEMLTLTVRVAQRFGGSVRGPLGSLADGIRQREQARRQLWALTGETRLSAWILGAIPVAVGCWVAAINPDYLGGMWRDPTGRVLLLLSVGLQISGCWLLHRMLRAV